MPDQPSKESLERSDALITRIFACFYSGRDAKEFRHAFRREVKPILALEFDAIAAEAAESAIRAEREYVAEEGMSPEQAELRQQNAALVSALRGIMEHVYSREYEKYYAAVDAARQALAPYAPAEEAQGKPASGTEEI